MKRLLLLVMLCLFAVTGCKENPTEALLDTYQQRLTNILDVEPDTIPPLDIPSYPHQTTYCRYNNWTIKCL